MSALPALMFALGALLSVPAVAQSPSQPAKAEPAPPAAASMTNPTAGAPASAAPAAARDHALDGSAAYYSKRLHGRKTASGKLFDQNALTAAHPTLPFGTRVKVTNTKNGRSVVVRINDRGPTQSGRVIDLSRAAAKRLGILRSGLVPVKLEVVSSPHPRKSGK